MKNVKFIDFPLEIQKREKEYQAAIKTVLNSGWFILGPQVRRFEAAFAKYLGVKYCVGVGNGLEAIQIALLAIGIGLGDEVITTPVSAAATTLAIIAVGAKPVFVDTDEYGLMNLELIPRAIAKRTKAILPVHLFGNAVDLQGIRALCRKYNLLLVEDACQAHGASFYGKKLGTFGEINCFSFYPTKNLGAFGDGGAIVTNSARLAQTCLRLRDYGQKSKYFHTVYGLNSRLDELQAAILSVRLSHLDEDNQKRRRLAGRYLRNLAGLADVTPVVPGDLRDANFHIFALRTKSRQKLQKFLAAKKIPTQVHYPIIIPDQPFLKSHHLGGGLRVSRRFVKEVISLPIHPWLSLADVDCVSQMVIKGLRR